MKQTEYVFVARGLRELAHRDGQRVTKCEGTRYGPPSLRHFYAIRFADGEEKVVSGRHLRSLTVEERDEERPLLRKKER